MLPMGSRIRDGVCWFGACLALGHHGSVEAATFEDVTAAAGISAPHVATYWAIGQAWADLDRDGDLDLYLTRCGGLGNLLYLNDGAGHFVLAPWNHQVALAAADSGGAVFADYDNDGWPDLYVLTQGDNVLFRNLRGSGFVDVTAAAGVEAPGEGQSAAWGDYDDDGRLDLYVVNWGDPGSPGAGALDVLYHNNGDGTFTDVSSALTALGLVGAGFAAGWLDFDNDGDRDLYVVNDKFYGNKLWRNDGSGCGAWCFTEIGVSSGAHRPLDGMGLAILDFDGDHDLDLYFSGSREAVLLASRVAQGSPSFVEISTVAGVSPQAIGWGTVAFDADNDGWQDLYLATSDAPNRLYRNRGDGTFEDLSAASGAADPGFSRGVAKGDFDQDGRVDLIVGNQDQEYRLYRNLGTPGEANHWLTIDLAGGGAVNRDGYGTRVFLTLGSGRIVMQELDTASSLGGGNDGRLHFGLGTETVSSARFVWSDGTEFTTATVPRDRLWTVGYPDHLDLLFQDSFETGNGDAWSLVVGSPTEP